MSDNNRSLEIRFTQAARRHHIGRASVRHVMVDIQPVAVTTTSCSDAWLYLGPDERGRELEIIAIEVWQAGAGPPYLLVIHVMPTEFRG